MPPVNCVLFFAVKAAYVFTGRLKFPLIVTPSSVPPPLLNVSAPLATVPPVTVAPSSV